MTMTKVDKECSRYPQLGQKPYFDSALISSLCCSESHGRAVRFEIWEFCNSSFGDFGSKILQKMSLVNAVTHQLQFGILLCTVDLDFWIVKWKLINRYHFSRFLTGLSYSIFPLILSCRYFISSLPKILQAFPENLRKLF